MESPSPTVSTRPVEISVATTLVTEGALNPDARTKSALEQGPDSRRSRNSISAFVWRSSGGRPSNTGRLVMLGHRQGFHAWDTGAVSIMDVNLLLSIAGLVVTNILMNIN